MRWKWLLLFTVVITGCYVNLIYYKPVTALPPDAELLAHINSYDRDHQVQTIVDRTQLDKHHYVVPVKFSEHQNGLSFWQWQRGKWRLVQFTTKTLLHWQLDKQDPATNYIVWHLANWQTANVEVHFVRERYFSIYHEDVHQYYPRIQLTHSFLLKGSGALPFPEQWSEIMTNAKKSAAPLANFSFFSEGVPEEFTFWATYDDAFLEGSGSTYVTGEVKPGVSFFMYMDDWQLER